MSITPSSLIDTCIVSGVKFRTFKGPLFLPETTLAGKPTMAPRLNRIRKFLPLLLLLLLVQPFGSLQAADSMGFLVGPEIEEFKVSGYGSSTFYSEADVADQNNKTLDMSTSNIGVVFPVMMRKDMKMLSTVNYKRMDIDTNALFPETQQKVPDALEDLSFSIAGRTKMANGMTTGAEFRFGSASDSLFHSTDEIKLGATFFVRMPSAGPNAWYFFLDGDNSRDDLPVLPGVGYMISQSDDAWALIGLPFMMAHYQPTDRLTLDLKYMVLRDLHARATARITEKLDTFVAFDWNTDRFERAGRNDDSIEIQSTEKTLSTGLTVQIHQNLTIELVGGYAFDRSLFEAKDYTSRRDNMIDIGGSAFGMLNLECWF